MAEERSYEDLEIQLSAAIEVNQYLAREVERLALQVDSLQQQLKRANAQVKEQAIQLQAKQEVAVVQSQPPEPSHPPVQIVQPQRLPVKAQKTGSLPPPPSPPPPPVIENVAERPIEETPSTEQQISKLEPELGIDLGCDLSLEHADLEYDDPMYGLDAMFGSDFLHEDTMKHLLPPEETAYIKEEVCQSVDIAPLSASTPVNPKWDEMQQFYQQAVPGLTFIPSQEIDLGGLLGEGAFGATYKATWRGKTCAVKMVRVENAAADSFFREVASLSMVDHPNIVKLFGVVIEPPERSWLVCEYLSGGPLSAWLYGTKGGWPPRRSLAQRLQIALDIASGMSVLESNEPPILHRDLKPANILLDDSGRARVADFGLSRVLTPDALLSLTPETGSYLWMAPEMVRHDLYLGPADIWSFGVLLVEILTQTRPYAEHHLTPVQVALQVADGLMQPAIPLDCPAPLVSALKAIFNIDPMKRPSFAVLCAVLRHVLNEMQGHEESNNQRPAWQKWLKA